MPSVQLCVLWTVLGVLFRIEFYCTFFSPCLHNALQEFRGGRRKELLNMSGSSFGTLFQVTTWGESHGPGVGVVIDGCPAGISLTEKDIQTFLDRRKPGQSKYTTKRNESDTVEILSGVFEGRTTGTPISLMVRNQDQRSRDYGDIAVSYRPGHADFCFREKYGFRDYRGGGRSSGGPSHRRASW